MRVIALATAVLIWAVGLLYIIEHFQRVSIPSCTKPMRLT
jgi:hypothetical protein